MKLTKLTLMLPVALGAAACSTTPRVQPAIVSDPVIERKVDSVLKQMTLEEKIGQMTQINIDVITQGGGLYSTEFPLRLDEAMLDTLITKYKVGSVLNAPGVTPLTPEEWAGVIETLQKKSLEEIGIPMVYGLDHIHGVTYVVGGTMLPQNVNMGASFNPSLAYEGGKITAYESMAANVPWSFSPVLDLGRNPCWPRMWESYGEDPYLVSVMGVANVKGLQGDDPNHLERDHIAACLKHYMGYGVPNSGKDRTPASISAIDMRERHFAPFLEAIRAGALSLMVNSGVNNGLPVHADHDLLTNWLKRDLGWDGMIVTDWADINNLCLRDHICETKKEAIALAINAGIDMAMVPYEFSFCTDLKELVEEGTVKMERIDDAVRRVLRMKFRLGLFDRPYWSPSEYPDFGCEAYADVARKAAEESITLLKNNDNVLPLRKNARILLAGPNADAMRPLNGGWTLSWQGEKADFYGEKYNTIREALVAKVGASNVVYVPGVTYRVGNPPTTSINYWEENAPEIDKAVRAAAGVDYIVLCLGENSYCETPGNLNDLTLSANQLKLASALAATGKPVILVLTEGRPRIIASIEPQMKAVLQTYLPGNYGGEALANILYGDVNPSGKLPYTYPRYTNSLTTYDHKPCESVDKMEGAYNYDAVVSVQWAFGYGLSYTTFAYSNLKVDKTEFKSGDLLTFTVDVTNTGERAGKESVLLFSSDRVASVTPDVRRLRAFDKIELQPGETQTVTLQVKADDLAFVGLDAKWRLEKGKFGVQVGDQTVEIDCLETKVWDTPNR